MTRWFQAFWPLLLVICGALAWCWPIGIGGAMPVGGDATQFSFGLMSYLGESLQATRWPDWNERWGFGFPGVAESQMGVYYPPHWALYGRLRPEAAFAIAFVLHVVWGALGTFLAARAWGLGRPGSLLAALAWVGNGYFVIHAPHHWGMSTASWMPWAWACLAQPPGAGGLAPLRLWALSAVLALQALLGHFQIAFETQVSVLVLALAALFEPSASSIGVRIARLFAPLLALGLAAVLAAAQLLPTLELAGLAQRQRTFEYLSGFAASPPLLISYLAPWLFHRSPLWRPVVWDTLHTSPEEYLATVGLLPLFFAFVALRSGLRTDRRVRSWAQITVLSLLFALGPNIPGFSWLIELPGFSFFRAPARWTIVTALALSLLAGRGLDLLLANADEARLRRALRRFALISALLIGAVVFLFELALWSTSPGGSGLIAAPLDWLVQHRPWSDDLTLPRVMSLARNIQAGPQVDAATAREGLGVLRPGGYRLADQRLSIYGAELGLTATLLAAIFVIGLSRLRMAWIVVALMAVAGVEWTALSRSRLVENGPIRDLTEQSPVLSELARLPVPGRSVDPTQNLAIATGAAPVYAYRTIDLPIDNPELAIARAPLSPALTPQRAEAALASLGAGMRIDGPMDRRIAEALAERWGEVAVDVDVIDDPTLTGWLLGSDWVRATEGRSTSYVVVRRTAPATIAWFLPATRREPPSTDAPLDDRTWLRRWVADGVARPVPCQLVSPQQVELEFVAESPGTLLVTRGAYPGWQAMASSPEGTESIPVATTRSGWQSVEIKRPGSVRLSLTYPAVVEHQARRISLIAWGGWLILGFVLLSVAVIRRQRSGTNTSPTGAIA